MFGIAMQRCNIYSGHTSIMRKYVYICIAERIEVICRI